MDQPTVCAIMLTKDRPAMARRAVECFQAQTYKNKRLLVVYSGQEYPCPFLGMDCSLVCLDPSVYPTVGALRNFAVQCAGALESNVIVHFDDDDWSHSNRIAEQVELLQSSGADIVGYREMLFAKTYRSRFLSDSFGFGPEQRPAIIDHCEAWLYSNPNPTYALGTSLCYWRSTWEKRSFRPTSQGEDFDFLHGRKVASVSAMDNCGGVLVGDNPPADCFDVRIIARIHAGNTSNAYTAENMRRAEWRRVPEWDAYAKGIMAR